MKMSNYDIILMIDSIYVQINNQRYPMTRVITMRGWTINIPVDKQIQYLEYVLVFKTRYFEEIIALNDSDPQTDRGEFHYNLIKLY